MKISRDWLGDYVNWIENDPEIVADRITRGMGEVDEVEKQGSFLGHCVVGKILTLEKHSNADKLSLCTVQTEQGTKSVVCGGTNLKKDMLVAFAHIGATVKWHGGEQVTLTRVKIRGVESEGMICAGEELEIDALFPAKKEDGERAIVDLSRSGYDVGTPLRKALGLTDVIFHIDNHAITNRPDLFSHVGVARELVAMGLAKWKKEPKTKACVFPKKKPSFTLKNDAKDLVPYYDGCEITLGETGSSPDWMQRRLLACGFRPINLVVDITNYVLLEIGMPLHAFDTADFKGALHIRSSKKGEKIMTLDKSERMLPENTVVISDDAGIFDLFGVMGGLRTSTKSATKRILLQAGIIDPVSVRKTVIGMDHRTDAATVYEKGVLPVTADMGLKRAIELFLELSPGSSVASELITWGESKTQTTVKIREEKLRQFIGANIKTTTAVDILENVGCDVKKIAKETLAVTPPLWRRDITHPQDIVEEVARIHGYANIAPVMPDACIVPPERETRIHALRDALAETGAFEMLHLAFVSPEHMKKWTMNPEDGISIENPIGEELSIMRTALFPSLVDTAARELKHTVSDMLKVFEVGHVFRKNDEHQGLSLAVVARGKTTIHSSPLLIAKADILLALARAGYDATVQKGTVPLPGIAHEGRSAEILVDGTLVGHLFELHPALQASLGLPGRAAIATLGLHRLLMLPARVTIAKPIPAFPAVTFDETIELSNKRTYEKLASSLRHIDPLLTDIETVNLYEKDALKTLTLRFTYRAGDRTLTQQEVEKVHAKVLTELKKS